MNTKSKSGDDKEPIDAEFETLKEEVGSAPPQKARSMRWVVYPIILVAIIGGGVVGWNKIQNNETGTSATDNRTDIAALIIRLDALQSELSALQARTEAQNTDMSARLTTLENRPVTAATNTLDLTDVQNRLSALEDAEPAQQAVQNDDSALVQRLDQLEAQILALPARPDAAPVNHDDTRLQALDDRLSALESAASRPDTAPLDVEYAARLDAVQNDLAALETRLEKIESNAPLKERQGALMLSLLALDSAAQSGAPFVREWQALAEQLPGNADVRLLQPVSRTGVPSMAALSRDFSNQISVIRQAGIQDNSKPGMMGKAKAALGSLVSVRRVDGGAKGVDAILANAEAALRNDNLPGALDALVSLNDPARKAAQGWIAQAQARVTFDQALARLKTTSTEVRP